MKKKTFLACMSQQKTASRSVINGLKNNSGVEKAIVLKIMLWTLSNI